MGLNVWPDEALLESRLFRDPVKRYFTAVNGLALDILRLVTQTLPYTQSVFEKFTSGYVVTPLPAALSTCSAGFYGKHTARCRCAH